MNEIDVSNDGEVTISNGGKKIIHFFLPKSDRIQLILMLIDSIKENPAKSGGEVVRFPSRDETDYL